MPATEQTTRRRDNWPELLDSYIALRAAQPFAWGGQDCCLFASDWVAACTGIDLAAAERGEYATPLGAARVLKLQAGVLAIARTHCEAHGFQEIEPEFARRGDMVCFKGGRGDTLGVCLGDKIAAPGRYGLEYVPMKAAFAAWRID